MDADWKNTGANKFDCCCVYASMTFTYARSLRSVASVTASLVITNGTNVGREHNESEGGNI